jgi:hypothetical protein
MIPQLVLTPSIGIGRDGLVRVGHRPAARGLSRGAVHLGGSAPQSHVPAMQTIVM